MGSQVCSVTPPGDVNAFCGDLSHLIWLVHLPCRALWWNWRGQGGSSVFLSTQDSRAGYKHSQEGIVSCFSSCLHPTKQLSSTEDRLASPENNGVLMRALLPETAASCTLALVVLLENLEFHILVCRLHRFPCCANPCSYHHLLPSRYCMFVGLKSELRSLSCFPQACEFH